MANQSIAPAARPIPGHNRLTGELVALMPSCSQPNVFHITTAARCSCKGYQYRGRCRHVTQPEPLPCTGCRNYHRTDADRLRAHPDARRDGGVAFLRALS